MRFDGASPPIVDKIYIPNNEDPLISVERVVYPEHSRCVVRSERGHGGWKCGQTDGFETGVGRGQFSILIRSEACIQNRDE